MLELLFKKKYSKLGFMFGLLLSSVSVTLLFIIFVGPSLMAYIFGGIFWITGRYFYNRIAAIVNKVAK